MPATNLILHALAAFAFIGLGLLWARASSERRQMARFLAMRWQPEIVYIEWPQHFIRRFAKAFMIPLGDSAPRHSGTPARLDPRPWVELHLHWGIRDLDLRGPAPWQLKLGMAQCPDDVESWIAKLQAALAEQVEVSLTIWKG